MAKSLKNFTLGQNTIAALEAGSQGYKSATAYLEDRLARSWLNEMITDIATPTIWQANQAGGVEQVAALYVTWLKARRGQDGFHFEQVMYTEKPFGGPEIEVVDYKILDANDKMVRPDELVFVKKEE